MSYFFQEDNFLDYQNAGETLRILPWGPNSLRVISVPNGPLDLSSSALLDAPHSDAEIIIGEDSATIKNGKISATIDTRGWNSSAVISFYNEKGELILKEIDGGGALMRKSRFFKSHIGGDYQLKTTFEEILLKKCMVWDNTNKIFLI